MQPLRVTAICSAADSTDKRSCQSAGVTCVDFSAALQAGSTGVAQSPGITRPGHICDTRLTWSTEEDARKSNRGEVLSACTNTENAKCRSLRAS